MHKYVRQERCEGTVTVTIHRPEALNALNAQVLEELEQIFTAMSQDHTVKVVILTGVGKAFVAGADIVEMRDMTPEQALAFSRQGHRVFDCIANARPVVIAAINGYALGGGCELALCCDIRVAVQSAKLGIPEVTLGVFPGFAGTQRLPRLVGLGIAKEMLATAKAVDAQRAYEISLVNHAVPDEELLPYCMKMAQMIERNSATAISAGKKLMDMGCEMDLEKALEYEAALFGVAFSGADQREGMCAFIEKRKPNFQA